MKLTPYKIARVKYYARTFPDVFMTQEEITQIDEGNWSSELTSKINKIAWRLLPNRLKRTKGAFGKRK
jgi:hypothetical protein